MLDYSTRVIKTSYHTPSDVNTTVFYQVEITKLHDIIIFTIKQFLEEQLSIKIIFVFLLQVCPPLFHSLSLL